MSSLAARAAERLQSVLAEDAAVPDSAVSQGASDEAKPSAWGRVGRWRERRLAIAFFALMQLLVCAGLLAIHFTAPYFSDEVTILTMVASWRPGERHTLWLSADTWIIKVPLYLLMGLLPSSPLTLLVEAVIVNVIGFGLFFASFRYFVGRRPTLHEYLPILWLTTLGTAFYQTIITPNLRNTEIGWASY